jgi:hypothetical protein
MKIAVLSLVTIILSLSIILQSFSVTDITTSKFPAEPVIMPTPSPVPIPSQKILDNDYHIFQTFNNCGPASLSMALSYYGINVSQKVLGDSLRPYQISNGDNDDKSVTLSELSEKAKEYGFTTFHRPSGHVELIKGFIAIDIPVITRTTTKPGEDIGHFRVIKGYNDTTKTIVQDDSLQGKNLNYGYSDFENLWEKFNYEYLVLVPENKVDQAKLILGDETDEQTAWKKAVDDINKRLNSNPDNIFDRFNLSVALFHTGDFSESVSEYEKVANRLPMRMLWYQMEPIKAYFEVKNYERVMEITNRILNGGNRAYSEVYILRGQVYLKQGNLAAAIQEFQKAVYYNKNMIKAQEALQSVSTN